MPDVVPTRALPDRGPVHATGEVLATRRAGAYRVLTLAVPGIPERFRPGQFVAVSLDTAHLARRPLWIHRVRATGTHGATLEVVVEPCGVGGRWLSALPQGARLPVTGPLGRPFALPRESVPCLLVGEGYSAAALFSLAERLRDRECPVTMLVAARDEAHLLSALEARRLARSVTVVTEDGSVGSRGTAATHVGAALDASGAPVVYAAGAASTLAVVAREATARGVSSQVALERPMPCATGLCHACVVPVLGGDGGVLQVRACLEGPALPGDRVLWDELG
ncbi:dihydroorotate dehydrogenase electron transfer subunit [Nocardioides houyundeii]|uniref:iron-sulfur cluster-binding protein n=1 Tax=Nocardioides houyundeii TaxID=2045452 RepID=UPI000DF1639F|nr:dihydroorotate dehydrogenase electron transfer subunit [Nocardioides houyundeii]